ncbi:MAG: hypothetical protein HFK07_06460 [Clostridia bacterium]|jgi:vacuolar-type H+-ATPase subunit E/Vma4|nr:hypothetical protein [Clostridia bacterium]
MIDELVNSIIDAENRAEEIIKAARKEAKEIAVSTSDEIESMKKESELSIRVELKNNENEGLGRAEEEYSKIIYASHVESEEIQKRAEKNMVKAREYVAGRLLEKYADR